jgi:glutamate-1-semialdehyde 2,1-aminomutase
LDKTQTQDSRTVTTERYATSHALLERSRQALAGGISSPVRLDFPELLFFRDALGPRLWDVDGNEYIDYSLAWGLLILGHRHPRLVEALRHQAGLPHVYGAQHELEYAVAEKVQQLVPCAERVAFTSSGTEAVQLALRLARAFTGRALVMKFEGHYHGWVDSILLSYKNALEELGLPGEPRTALCSKGQVPNSTENVVTAEWNNLASVERVFKKHGRSLAAVIAEPVAVNSGALMPEPGFLAALRRLTQEQGALLIFDEVITGFRIGLGGAQAAFGITPDLATFGKAVGGGLPLSVIAGRKEIMEQIAGGGVAYGGSYNGNPIVLTVAKATLDELSGEGGAALGRANQLGTRLMDGLRSAAKEAGVPLLIAGFGTAFSMHFTASPQLRSYRDTLRDDKPMLARFLRLALDEGLWLLPDGRVYTSAVHTEREIEETVAAARRAFARLRAHVDK